MDHASHLSAVLDLSPCQWELSANSAPPQIPLSLQSFLAQFLAFLNAHVAAQHENTLAVFGALPGRSVLLYASTEEGVIPVADGNSYRPFKIVDSTIVTRIVEELDALGDTDEEEEPSQLVGAVTKALCYINRTMHPVSANPRSDDPATHQTDTPDPRILILSVSQDAAASYIPMMNAIFSAQKLKITIDVCKLFGPETVFLQQAAHLTGGSYIAPERRDALLQYMVMAFLPHPALRGVLATPTQDKIDYRAACFCHKRIVDIGFVCSVCLSIFCQPVPICSTCRTKFPIKTLQRLNATRLPSTSAVAPTPARTPSASSSSPNPNVLPVANGNTGAAAAKGRNGVSAGAGR